MVVSERSTTRSGQLLFTIDDLPKLVEIGILTEDSRIELIEGQLYVMSPIGTVHADLVDELLELLGRLLGQQVRLRGQNPLYLNQNSLPQPDITILKRHQYRNQHPRSSDVFIVVEVSDTTLEADRTVKAMLYASAGIPEYWIVDAMGKALEQYTQPAAQGYTQRVILKAGETVKTAQFPDFALPINQIFRIETDE